MKISIWAILAKPLLQGKVKVKPIDGFPGKFTSEHFKNSHATLQCHLIFRATELLDLSSGDSRDTPGQEDFMNQQSNNQGQGLIPQIVMNPWDPSQAPMMTFALQSYQHQWLLQQQQQQVSKEHIRVIFINTKIFKCNFSYLNMISCIKFRRQYWRY